MSVVQTEYPNFHDAQVDGQIADTTTCDVDSYVLTGAGNTIAFGRAFSFAAAAGAASDRLAVPYAGARFAGIAVQDERLPGTSAGRYATGDPVSGLWRGDVAVKVSAAVNNGDDVVIATAASGAAGTAEEVGQMSSKAADGTHIALPGARFITSADAQGIAVVRLTGAAPAA